MLRFAAFMPDMDTEVALKIIEQFPAFKEFALCQFQKTSARVQKCAALDTSQVI